MANYIGKIAAVGTINMSQIASGLNASARDVEKYARTVRSTIVSANSAAGRSFQEIFTPLQRLERALQAANTRTLDIKVGGTAERIRAIVGAANDIARPLTASQKQFTALSATIQNEFIGSLTRAQNAAQLAENAINRGQIKNAAGYERLKQVVDRFTESQRRLSEVSSSVGGLATGRELRFQQAGFAAELQRTSALQSQASALPADARASGAVAQLVELQRREADEAARLLAVLENVRNTRRGDAAAAQANLDAQTQRLAQVNLQLERQVALYNEVEQRQRQTATAASQVAARESATELNRRDGTLARRNAAAFVESTASLVSDPEIARRQKELERSSALRATFSALPADAQASLERQRQQFENIAISAEKGAVSVGILADANDRLAVAVEGAREASADQQRRREVATALLPPVVEVPSQEQQRSDLFGRPVDDAARRLGVLQGAINSVKGAVDQLPIPLQTRFVPLLAQAEANLIALKNSGTATAAAIKIAADEVSGLKSQVEGAAKASNAFGGTFRQFVDASDFRAAAGGLDFLRSTLIRAKGDTTAAEDAINKYTAALRKAASVPGGFRRFSAELSTLRDSAVAAVAATQGVGLSARRINEGIQRTGDVARGSFGNAGLAVQQAIFAFDDFFSVTGDLSQRIRAAGNNLSQFGFIIGGTAGLIAGVLTSAIAQGAVALINWANAGVKGQDRTKALNDVLSEQKGIVDRLADSFAKLGRSLSLSAFRGGARDAEEFTRQIRELRDEQQEQLRGRAAAVDPAVIRERAIQNARRAELERTSNIGEAVLLQREIEQSRIRERSAANAAFSRPAVNAAEIRDLIAEEVRRQELRRNEDARLLLPEGAQAALERQSTIDADRARQRFIAENEPPGTPRDAENLVRRRIDELAARRRSTSGAQVLERSEIDSQAQTNAQRLNALQRDRLVSEANAQVLVIEQIRAFGLAIQQSQEAVAEAIRQGEPNSIEFGRQLLAAAQAVSQAEQEFREAGKAVLDAIELPTGTSAERDLRDAAIRGAERRRAAAQEAVSAAQAAASPLEQSAIQLRRRAFVSPQRTLEATLGRARDNIQQSGLPDGAFARLLRALEFQRNEIAREADDPRTTDERRQAIERELAAVGRNIQAIESASGALRSFARDFSRAVQASEQAADEAQRRVNQAEGVGGPSVGQLERDRDRIEENLEIDQRFVRNIENQLQAALAALSNNPDFRQQSDRLNQLRNEAEAAAALAIQTNVPEDPRDTVDRANQIAMAEQALDEIRKRSQEGIQKQAEAELRLRAARDRQEEFLRADRDRRQPTGDAVRGLGALGGARQRAQDEVSQRQADIEAARQARGNVIRDLIVPGQGEDVNVARQQLEAAQRRLEQERFRQRQFANLFEPVNQADGDAGAALTQAELAQSAAQVFSGLEPDFGTDLPSGAGNIEEAQQAIEKARELLQQVSLLGSNAKPEDFAELAKIFPMTLEELFSERDLNNLQAASFVGAGVEGATQDDAREAARRQIAEAQRELNAFVNAGRPTVEAASAEVARQDELFREARAGLEEVLKGAGLRGVDLLGGRQDDLLAQRLADAARSVEFAQAAFDEVNQPFADLEKNEREAAQARLRAIQDITDLGLSDQQKFANGLQDSLGEVQAQAEEFLGADDRRAALESLTNAQNNLARQNAPLFAQFSDEVANAVLQGPSRAALQVSDASTTEGQRELNRLLRGDDSARDVNLVELQKQSTFLQSIDSGISTLKERLGIAQ